MALYHDATVVPSKVDLIRTWLPNQSWCPEGLDDPDEIEVIGAYRFDDPEGQVGIESHIARVGDAFIHVPLTYRAAPVEGNEAGLVATTEHSALGTRWVYDGLTDERYLVMAAAVSLTGQGEALGMVVYDGQWFIAPTPVRIRGGGWPVDRVSVHGFATADVDAATVQFANAGFDMTVHRLPQPGAQPPLGLTATWDGLGESILLTEIAQRST